MLLISRWASARIPAVAIILAVGFFGARAGAEEPAGLVVVARTQPNALLVWDASPVVGDLVIARRSGDAAMRSLEGSAIAILGQRAARMRAPRIEMNVQYAPGGVVGGPYQASTFANETRLIELSAPRALAASNYKAWIADIANGRVPRGLRIVVVGKFPQAE